MSKKITLKKWFQIATTRSVVWRALMCAVVVGTILISINHGPKIVCNEVTHVCVIQMLLTYCVPYAVSTFSSVQAILKPCRDA